MKSLRVVTFEMPVNAQSFDASPETKENGGGRIVGSCSPIFATVREIASAGERALGEVY